MNGDDTLQLDSPGAYGTLSAKVGDTLVLQGVTATSAAINTGALVVAGIRTSDMVLLPGPIPAKASTERLPAATPPWCWQRKPAPVVGGFKANQTGTDNAA